MPRSSVIIPGEVYKNYEIHIMNFSAAHGYFLFLRPKFSPRYAGLKDPDPCSSVRLKDQVLLSCRTTGQITVQVSLNTIRDDKKILTIRNNFLLNAKFQYHSWSP
jgi:hypothetical protein